MSAMNSMVEKDAAEVAAAAQQGYGPIVRTLEAKMAEMTADAQAFQEVNLKVLCHH